MLIEYSKFINDFDKLLDVLFETQKQYIKCKKGCSKCCVRGEYPYSQLEFSYLTQGFISLPPNTKILVQQNIRNILMDRRESKEEIFEYVCPFLINGECCVYDYRGIVCRTFGLCYYDDTQGYVRLPNCATEGLNYSEYFDSENNELDIIDVPKVNLRIDRVFNSELAKKYNLDCGEIRPMIEWFGGIKKVNRKNKE